MTGVLGEHVRAGLLERNARSRELFGREASRLAELSGEMSERFGRGGRLLAFGKGPYATDAQHVSVEFVHPVIVGKRALPALDISVAFAPWLDAMVGPDDMVMGFAPPGGDADITRACARAGARQALTFTLAGAAGTDEVDYALAFADHHPFVQQELTETLYHVLWETVHVFFEHRELGHDVGASGFLYPFLGEGRQDTSSVATEVAASIRAKAGTDEELRLQVLAAQTEAIAGATEAIARRLGAGGKIVTFGNGGSATDANDLALDCLMPPAGLRPVPAISLAMESANLSAIANDVGTEVTFLRQLVAQAEAGDVAVAFSTSGSSENVAVALGEARRRGLLTVALLGYDGGDIARNDLADVCIVVPSDYIPRIQEVQASIYHLIRSGLEVAGG